MSDEAEDLYDKYIDYDDEELDTRNVGDRKVIRPITAENFEMEKRVLGEVLTDQKFNVPEYQRLYSWKNIHHEQYWSDIQQFVDADLVADRREVSDVFFSSMYFAVNDDKQVYEVIDGQQRLTTSHILLRVLMEHLEAIDPEAIEDGTLADFREYGIGRIEDILYVEESFGSREPRLTLNKHDAAFFKALMIGPAAQVTYLTDEADYSIHGNNTDAVRVSECLDRFGTTDDELAELDTDSLSTSAFFKLYRSHRRLLDAYEFYDEKVTRVVADAETPDQTVRALVNVLNFVYNSYHVGEYLIREAESDFRMQIFEILNDRGVDLTKIDRIRAAVVNAFFDTDVKDEYIKKWEDIVVAFATDGDAIDDYLSIYLSIVDDGIDQIGDASAELTNAFDTRNIDSKVEPRLLKLNDAKEFIDYANALIEYYQDITTTDLIAEDLNLASHREQCREILVRLNNQRMDQWQPFVLALYYHTNPESEHEAAQFYHVLETIEKLNLRRLLISERPGIFRQVFIEAVETFDLAPTADVTSEIVYEQSREFLIAEMQSSTPSLFGDRFIDTIVQTQSWSTGTARLLFGKMAQDYFDEPGRAVDRDLNLGNIHLEHVLPQTPVNDPNDPTWLREFFKLDSDPDIEIASEIEHYIELLGRSDLDEEEERLIDNISEFITQGFIDDIGNFLLLRDTDNIGASNRPLAEKMPQYYAEIDGFVSIYPNRYFTADHGAVDRHQLDRLRAQAEDGSIAAVDEDVVAYFNAFWNYESLQDRRVDLLFDILMTLVFDSIEDEFGIVADQERVRREIREKTDQEFEKRLSVRSL